MAAGLILILYNADSGLVSLVRDWVVKLVRPEAYPCRLCLLTHGPFRMHARWAETLAALPHPHLALHRDEWLARCPGDATALPAILLEEDGHRRVLVSADDFAVLPSLEALCAMLGRRLAAA